MLFKELRICLVVIIFLQNYVVTPFKTVQLEPFEEDCLDAHNIYRAEHGVPPLTWSADLATRAQSWADHLATNDELQHDATAINKDNEGENLAFFLPAVPKCQGLMVNNCVLCREMVKRWYDEEKKYDFDSGTPSKPDGVIKHFTQLVWADTTEVGIGTAVSKKYGFITVARYKPQGNRGGVEAFIHNVPPEGGPLPSLGSSNPDTATSSTPTGLGVPSEDNQSLNATTKTDAPDTAATSATSNPTGGNPTGLGIPADKTRSLNNASNANASLTKRITGLGVPLEKSAPKDKDVVTVQKISPLVMVTKPWEGNKNRAKYSERLSTKLDGEAKKLGKELTSLARMLAQRKFKQQMKAHGENGGSNNKGQTEGEELETHVANKDFSYENSDQNNHNGIIGWRKESIGQRDDQQNNDIEKDGNENGNRKGDINESANDINVPPSDLNKGLVHTLKGPDGTDAQLYVTRNGAHAGIVFRDRIFRVTSEAADANREKDTEASTKRTIYVL